MKRLSAITAFISIMAVSGFAHAQGAIEITDEPTVVKPSGTPRVGRKAAAKYMGQAAEGAEAPTDRSSGSGIQPARHGDHYLAVHLGTYVSDKAYKWGMDDQSEVGDVNAGVTYRVGEWVNSMDLGIRIDYSSYGLQGGRTGKLSFLPVVTFPDATSRFPLYFGAGLGLGMFLNQISGESAMAIDYQMFMGVRFFEIFQNTGFFLEAGMKNHVHLVSDGQFNGTFVTLGPVFTF